MRTCPVRCPTVRVDVQSNYRGPQYCTFSRRVWPCSCSHDGHRTTSRPRQYRVQNPLITVQYNPLQHPTVHYSTPQYTTVHYSTPQYTAVHYSTLQSVTRQTVPDTVLDSQARRGSRRGETRADSSRPSDGRRVDGGGRAGRRPPSTLGRHAENERSGRLVGARARAAIEDGGAERSGDQRVANPHAPNPHHAPRPHRHT